MGQTPGPCTANVRMRRSSAPMKGTRPGHLPPASKTSEDVRVCAEPHCETKLSVYNQGEHCWQHAEVVFPNYRGKLLSPR